jgi:radical SAM superfamily enzyme YgiQ (UPF0313 family)
MKILLTNPPWYTAPEDGAPGRHGVRAGSRWPHDFPYFTHSERDGRVEEFRGKYVPFPFWLATACALLKREGFDAVLRDSIALGETYDAFFARVREVAPDVVILETASATLKHDLALVAQLREQLGPIRVVFCGLHSELEQPEFLRRETSVDFALYGEYENTLLALLRALRDGSPVGDIPGIVHRTDDGAARKTAFGALPPLDAYPWPERNADEAAYYNDTASGLPTPQLHVMATRGCPYGCIFCIWPQMLYRGGKYRKRSADDVVGEIAAQMATGRYASFYLDDDTYNINRKYVIELAQKIKESGLNRYPWGAMGRADLVDEEQLAALRDAGMTSVKYGVESADQQILDATDKRIDIEEVVRGVKLTHDFGIKVHLTFTIGLPGDTHETLSRTIDLACELPCASVQFSIATPYPGTKMYDMYKEKRWLVSQRWEDYVGSSKAVSRTENFSPEDLEAYVALATRRYAEADARRKLAQSGLVDELVTRVRERAEPGAPVVVLQSARVAFTTQLVSVLDSRGISVHVFAHERFAPDFAELLPTDRIHRFDESGNFNAARLADRCTTLHREHRFGGAIVPYSHRFGSGYEDVEKVAEMLGGGRALLAGVNIDGELIR